MATSIKVTGLVVGGSTLLAALLYRAIALRSPVRDVLRSVLALTLATVGTILLLNPLFWPEPGKVDVPVLAAEVRTLPAVVAATGIRSVCHRNRPQLANLCRLVAFPAMYPRWKKQLTYHQPKDPDWYFFRRPYRAMHDAFLKTFATVPYEWIFLPVGLAFCVKRGVEGVRQKRSDPAVVPALFFVANYALLLLFLPLDWDRYYLTLVIAAKMLIAIGVCWSVLAAASLSAQHRLRRRRTARATAQADLAGES
jgi:hypothetical protein